MLNQDFKEFIKSLADNRVRYLLKGSATIATEMRLQPRVQLILVTG